MYCKKCGKEVPDDSIYCNHCGTRQTPKKIVVEFNNPSIPSISEDSIRSGIFRFGRCLKKWIVSLKPLAIRLLLIGLITGAAYGIAYYSYYLFNLPQEANLSEIVLYREKGISSEENYFYCSGQKISYTSHKYENPSTILHNCKWDLDDDMINFTGRSFNGDSTDINETRKEYLNYRSGEFAYNISLIAFGICLLHFFIRLFVSFRKWLYKK